MNIILIHQLLFLWHISPTTLLMFAKYQLYSQIRQEKKVQEKNC
jgi:hypothetical protein